jgi:hypothetical protein
VRRGGQISKSLARSNIDSFKASGYDWHASKRAFGRASPGSPAIPIPGRASLGTFSNIPVPGGASGSTANDCEHVSGNGKGAVRIC